MLFKRTEKGMATLLKLSCYNKKIGNVIVT